MRINFGSNTTDFSKIMRAEKGTLVFSYGSPRTGTTFMQYLLSAGEGYYYAKMNENHGLHPCQNRTGLKDLSQTLSHYNNRVVFVRTVRNPLDIISSFRFARVWEAEKFGAENVGVKAERGLSCWTDEMIVKAIKDESHNTERFIYDLSNIPWLINGDIELIQIKYEEMADVRKQGSFLDIFSEFVPMLDRGVLENRFADFGKTSIRDGRQNRGDFKTAALTEDEKDKFKWMMSEVFEREGYAL